MHLVAIGWMYVVLLMSITEPTVVAGVMTLLLYGVMPLSVILYLMGTKQRKRNRAAAEKSRADSANCPVPGAPIAARSSDRQSDTLPEL